VNDIPYSIINAPTEKKEEFGEEGWEKLPSRWKCRGRNERGAPNEEDSPATKKPSFAEKRHQAGEKGKGRKC